MIGERWRRQCRKVRRLGAQSDADWKSVGVARKDLATRLRSLATPEFMAGTFVAGMAVGFAQSAGAGDRSRNGGSVSVLRLANTALYAWRLIGPGGVAELDP